MADSGGTKPPDTESQSTSGKVDTKLKKAERTQQTPDVSSPDPVTRSSTADGPSGQGKDKPSKSTESARSLPKVPGKNTLPQKQESKPPDTESHSTSGEVDTKPKEEERTRPTPNVSSPDATVTGRSTSDGPSGQGKDEPFKSAESAAGSMQNVPGEKSPTKNKNKGRYIQDITTNYEEKHKAEQKWVHSGEKQTGESTKMEIKPVIPKANTPVLSLDGTQDMVEKLRSDKKLAKQNKNQQITGADDVQQIQTPHPGKRRKATKEGEDHTSEKLDGSFVIVNPIQSANDNRAEVNKEKEMPDKPAGASKISENLQKDKTAGLDEEEEIKEDIVEENPVRSKLPTAFQSGLMRKRQDHSQVTASAPKLGENNEREEHEKQTGDLDNEREHKKENVQSLDNASVLQNTEKDKEGTCAQQDDSTEISINVKTLTGKVLTINIKQTDTIAKVREKIKDKEGTAVDDQRLVFEGKKLEVNQTLSDYNIGQGSIIHLVVRKTGQANRSIVSKTFGKQAEAASEDASTNKEELRDGSMKKDDDVPKQFENNLSEVEEQIGDSVTKKQEQECIDRPTPAPRKKRGTKDNKESVPENLNSGQSEITSRQAPTDEASSPPVPAQEKAIGESQHTDNEIPSESGSQLSRSSSFETISDKEQGETSFDEEKLSVQFQMSSMTQLTDQDMKDLEHNTEASPVKGPDMKTDIAVANGKVKNNTNADEGEENNNQESEDISPEYRLKQVGKTYILCSKFHKPVKVSQLNEKLNVCVEDNFILIEGEIVYSISSECGDIIISKVEEAKVEENLACSPSSITNDQHNGKEIPCKSEVKPEKEQSLNSEIEKLTDGIKHIGLEDTKDNQKSAPAHLNSAQSENTSKQAQTDEASSPTVPAREKATRDKDKPLSIPVRVYTGNSNKRLDVICNTVSEYLKWMFVIQNQEVAKQLSDPKIIVKNGEVVIRFGQAKKEKEFNDTVKNCLRTSMDGIFGLCVAFLEVNGIERDFLDAIEQSEIVKKHNLYLYMEESSQRIHFVCFENMTDHVAEELRQALKTEKLDFCIEGSCQEECKIMFENWNVRSKIAQTYHGVCFGYTVDYKKRSCLFCLRGQSIAQLGKAKHLVEEEINKYAYRSFPFSNIKNMKGLNTEFAVNYLQKELSYHCCKEASNDDWHFEVDNNAKRVFISASVEQGTVDSIATKVMSCISVKFINLNSMDEDFKRYLSNIQSEHKDNVYIDISDDICKCFGNPQVLNKIETHSAHSGEERRKRGKQTDEHAITKAKCVNLKDFCTFEFIKKTSLVKHLEQIKNVSLEPKETSDRFGFVIKGKEDKQIEDCEKLIESIEGKVKEKEINVTVITSQESNYNAFLLEVEKECDVLIKEKKEKCWVFDKGHSLILSHGAAMNCFKDLKVDIRKLEYEKECKPFLENVDSDRKRTQLYVPIYQETEDAGKQSHIFTDSMDATLKQSTSYDCTHICIPIDERFAWPFRKFLRNVLFPIFKHLNESGIAFAMLPVAVELCMKDLSDFVEACEITATALPPNVEEISSSIACERSVHRSNQMDMSIREGKLDEIETDVIVNTTASDLNLRTGAVSKSLLDKAGDEIQNECNQKYPDGIKKGNIAITRGYKLKCRHVLHGSLENYDHQTKTDLLKKIKMFVTDCLEKANFLGHTSIAFPVIGVGNLGYPEKQIADTLLDAVQEFKKKPGAINKLQKVTVVIFNNKELVKIFKKKLTQQEERKSKPVCIVTTSSHVRCAGITANAEVATLDACRKADALLVFWDYTTLPEASSKTQFVLQEMGKEACKEFFEKRCVMRTNLKPTSTRGGQLQNHIVVHVPVKDNMQSFKENLIKGILQADSNLSYSLALYFNAKDSPFLRYREQLTEACLEAFKEVAANLKNLSHVSLVFEGVLQPEKFFQVFEKDEMTVREDTSEKRSLVKVVGYEHNIKKAEERLNAKSLSNETEVLKEKFKGGAASGLQAPKMPMEGNDELQPGEKVPLADKETVLKKWDNTIGYVKVSHIPENYTYKELWGTLSALDLPSSNHRLIYLDGMSEAVLVCKTSEDALQLCQYNGGAPFMFSNMEKKGVGYLGITIAASDLTKLKQQGRYDQFQDGIKKLSATFNETDDSIKAPTTFQMVCVRKLVERLLEEDTTYNGFVILKPTCTVTIEGFAYRLWEIMQVEKEGVISEFFKSGGIITHKGEVLTVSLDKEQQNSMLDDVVNVFKSFEGEMKEMEFVEISIDAGDKDKITKWVEETEKHFGKRCCSLILSENKLIVYSDSYEKAKEVEHHFLVKQGNRKQTGRRRKGADGNGPCSLQPVYDSKPEVKTSGFEWGKDARNIQLFKTAEGIQIYVYEANILKLPVDCIVNAANDTLQHGGGVAEVIAKGAGPQLIEEGKRYVKTHGKIPVGEAVSTKAGNLHYNYVIHAVGPRWSDYKSSYEDVCRCEQDLFHAILNSCMLADEKRCSSIAFPAISSAIFGVPVDLCVCQYVKATIEASRRKLQYLTEIHFIDRKPEIIRQIQREFKTVLEENKESPYQRNSYIPKRRDNRNTSRGNSEFRQNSYQSNKSGYSKQSHKPYVSTQRSTPQTVNMDSGKLNHYTTDKGTHVYCLSGNENHTLHVYKGDLCNVKLAAVVVTVDGNRRGGSLSVNVVKKIREVNMYEDYRRSLEKVLPLNSKVGQMAFTKGFGTNFSHVIHVVFPFEEKRKPDSDRRKCMTDIYYKVLTTGAKEKDVDKIATTLIGIDERQDDVDLACNAFLDGYQSFLKDIQSTRDAHLEVHLVWLHEKHFERICSFFDSFAEGQLKQQQAASKAMSQQANAYHGNIDQETQDGDISEDCVICMDQMTNPKPLNCGHRFCTECIDKYFEIKKTCPTCGAVCGVITGDQPPGTMTVNFYKYRQCAGYEKYGQISITYTFSSGRQEPNHPNPGTWYKGITRTAYLPDSAEGLKVLEMLRVAFDRKLVFTIGSSRTTGQEGVITWNDIHHKTDPRPNTQFGYPDKTYLTRVKDELAAKGVTERDISNFYVK